MQYLRCVVERITYSSEESGYAIQKVQASGYKDLIAIVGNLMGAYVGSVLTSMAIGRTEEILRPV